MGEVSCDNCKHIKSCIAEYGAKRDDGDDYRAMVRTHWCRASWDAFYEKAKFAHKLALYIMTISIGSTASYIICNTL